MKSVEGKKKGKKTKTRLGFWVELLCNNIIWRGIFATCGRNRKDWRLKKNGGLIEEISKYAKLSNPKATTRSYSPSCSGWPVSPAPLLHPLDVLAASLHSLHSIISHFLLDTTSSLIFGLPVYHCWLSLEKKNLLDPNLLLFWICISVVKCG